MGPKVYSRRGNRTNRKTRGRRDRRVGTSEPRAIARARLVPSPGTPGEGQGEGLWDCGFRIADWKTGPCGAPLKPELRNPKFPPGPSPPPARGQPPNPLASPGVPGEGGCA